MAKFMTVEIRDIGDRVRQMAAALLDDAACMEPAQSLISAAQLLEKGAGEIEEIDGTITSPSKRRSRDVAT